MAEIRQAGLWKAISIKDVAGPTPANLLPFAEKALVEKLQGRSSNLPSWTTCVSFLGASPIRRCHHHGALRPNAIVPGATAAISQSMQAGTRGKLRRFAATRNPWIWRICRWDRFWQVLQVS